MERERHKIRLFEKTMPNFIQSKFLEEPETATVLELCTKASQKLILRELCIVVDWSRDGFPETSTKNLEKHQTGQTKNTETENPLETTK